MGFSGIIDNLFIYNSVLTMAELDFIRLFDVSRNRLAVDSQTETVSTSGRLYRICYVFGTRIPSIGTVPNTIRCR